MSPVLRRLEKTFLRTNDLNQSNSILSRHINSLDDIFYRKIILSHPLLTIEYSLLGQQIRSNLDQFIEKHFDKEQLVAQILAALILANILENLYLDYLNVPREVERLRAQKQLYYKLLEALEIPPPEDLKHNKHVDINQSLSQQVRRQTLNVNLYRLLFTRSKRLLDLISGLKMSSDWYRIMITQLDKKTDPFLPHIAWFFWVPRLTTNLFLLLKHTLPGPWMNEKERHLGWKLRFQSQMLRRWFELGNDLVWVGVGIVNCFILTGTLAPVGFYLALAFFGYDVVLAAIRAYIELNRLIALRKEYQAMSAQDDNKSEINQYLNILQVQIDFEILRFGSHVLITSLIFLATCCIAPLFASSPIITLTGAVCLVLICFINFALVNIINHKRPKDIFEPSLLGFFAKKNKPDPKLEFQQLNTTDINNNEDINFDGHCLSSKK